MHQRSNQPPFNWSQIHSIAKDRIAELDTAIRLEIGKPTSPVPEKSSEKHQFFLLLAEKAEIWAGRAKEAIPGMFEDHR